MRRYSAMAEGFRGVSEEDFVEALGEYEELLQSLERSASDFGSARRALETLGGAERGLAVQEWKEYLQDIHEQCKQMITSLEESTRNLSER